MTKVQEDNHVKEETTPSTASKNANYQQRIPLWMLIFLLIVVGCSLGVLYTMLHWRHNALDEIESLRANLSTIKIQQKHLNTQLDSTRDQAEDHWKVLDKRVNSVLKWQPMQTNDWSLLKVRSFLELAQMNAFWSSNSQATLELLNQA